MRLRLEARRGRSDNARAGACYGAIRLKYAKGRRLASAPCFCPGKLPSEGEGDRRKRQYPSDRPKYDERPFRSTYLARLLGHAVSTSAPSRSVCSNHACASFRMTMGADKSRPSGVVKRMNDTPRSLEYLNVAIRLCPLRSTNGVGTCRKNCSSVVMARLFSERIAGSARPAPANRRLVLRKIRKPAMC